MNTKLFFLYSIFISGFPLILAATTVQLGNGDIVEVEMLDQGKIEQLLQGLGNKRDPVSIKIISEEQNPGSYRRGQTNYNYDNYFNRMRTQRPNSYGYNARYPNQYQRPNQYVQTNIGNTPYAISKVDTMGQFPEFDVYTVDVVKTEQKNSNIYGTNMGRYPGNINTVNMNNYPGNINRFPGNMNNYPGNLNRYPGNMDNYPGNLNRYPSNDNRSPVNNNRYPGNNERYPNINDKDSHTIINGNDDYIENDRPKENIGQNHHQHNNKPKDIAKENNNGKIHFEDKDSKSSDESKIDGYIGDFPVFLLNENEIRR